jgi:hypothetical protein
MQWVNGAIFPVHGIISSKKTLGPHESIFLKREQTKITTGMVVLWETRI